jgi:hypothetical protein
VAPRFPLNRAALLVFGLMVWLPTQGSAQSLSVEAAGEQLLIRAPGLAFLKGEPVARLKDGRSVRIELDLMVLPAPGRTATVTVRRIFGLSYDLWEERFAVTTVDAPRRTISHLTAAAAELWCIEQLSVPLSALGRLREPDASFWVRLEYRILNADDGAGTDDGSAFTLQGLIDALSRRRRTESEGDAIEGGPFRLSGRGGLSRARR